MFVCAYAWQLMLFDWLKYCVESTWEYCVQNILQPLDVVELYDLTSTEKCNT